MREKTTFLKSQHKINVEINKYWNLLSTAQVNHLLVCQ